MSDFRIRSLERQARSSGDVSSLNAYVMSCLRSKQCPDHDLGVSYMQNLLIDAEVDYPLDRDSLSFPYRGKQSGLPYSVLIDWVSLGKKLNVSLMLQRTQLYVGAESTLMNNYFLDIEHFDDFKFAEAFEKNRHRAELITFIHESEFSSYHGPPGDEWPECPQESVFPEIDGRRAWETSMLNTLYFIKVETEFTYEETLFQALGASQD